MRQIILAIQRHCFGRQTESLPEDQLCSGWWRASKSRPRVLPPSRASRSKAAWRAEPRVETFVDVYGPVCPCCSGTLRRTGEDLSERPDVEPAQSRVLVILRPRYACRACEDAVVQASAPGRLIEGVLPTDALVAQVLISTYADHLPLYRQAQIFV